MIIHHRRNLSEVMCCLWWTEWHWGKFPPTTSVSPADSHPTKWSTLGSINRGGTVGQLVADVPDGLSLTSSHGITGMD
jgi:hypothetical protein